MSSDNARLRPTPGFKPSGVGLYMTFRCAACANVRGCVGRKLKRVMGLRQFVCQKCAETMK
jgi:hypothetical protein